MNDSVWVSFKSDGYAVVSPSAPKETAEILSQIDGTRRTDAWTQPRVTVVTEDDEGERLRDFDVSCIGSPGLAMVVTRKVVDRLGGFLRDYGEFLPLLSDKFELFIYNPIVVLDALDVSASNVARFPDGRMYAIWKHVFHSDAVKSSSIFRIPQLQNGPTFFTHRAVVMWRNCGFRGIDFKEVWPTPRKAELRGRSVTG